MTQTTHFLVVEMVSSGTILVTGGTTGIGYQAALAIADASPGYMIVIASRTDTKSAAVTIGKATGHEDVIFLPLDLSSFDKVRAFATDYSSRGYPPIKALVLNAGLQFPGAVGFTVDGIERTFEINHVSHALLFYLLRPHLANDARIVVTASGVHDPAQKTGMPDAEYTSAEEIAHPNPDTVNSDGRQRYTNSKLCNVMWAYALHRRFTQGSTPEQKWTVTSFDPGLVPGTGLGRDFNPVLRFLWNSVLPHLIPLLRLVLSPNIFTPQESGSALARLAIGEGSEGVSGISGVYFEGRKEIKSSVASYEVDKQEDLYEWTLKTVAATEVEKHSFGNVYG